MQNQCSLLDSILDYLPGKRPGMVRRPLRPDSGAKDNIELIGVICLRIGLVLWLSWIFIPFSLASTLSAEETRGKQLYVTGTSASGKAVNVLVGQQAIELPGSILPCVGCHGEDGLGRPEGGILPSNITWHHLTKSYGHQHPDSRTHPSFSAHSFAAAITSGIDPADNRLDTAMPRYQLSAEDINDLIAYLKRLSTDYDPGLTATSISVGSLLPVTGATGDMGRAIKGVLTAYFAELNARGGIYNRSISLEVIGYDSDSESARENLLRLNESEPLFAMVANVAGEMDKDILRFTESRGMPQIGTYTLFPENSFNSSRFSFYLLAGLRLQSGALLDYAADVLKLENPAITVIGPAGAVFQTAAEGVETQLQKHAWNRIERLTYSRGELDAQQLAAQLSKQSPEVIFYFGDDQTLAVLLAAVDQLSIRPYLFLSGSLAGGNIFNAPDWLRERIFLAYPMLPRDQTHPQEFAMLLEKYGLSSRHLAAQIIAYSSARLLVEGLQQAGREVSRKKLVRALETLYQFDNGLTPLLTYGPNRHIGAMGAYIVAIDHEKKRFSSQSQWIEPGEGDMLKPRPSGMKVR